MTRPAYVHTKVITLMKVHDLLVNHNHDSNEIIYRFNFGGGVVVKHFFHVWYMYFHFYSIADLPECQVPLSMRTDVIDQVLAMALHPLSDCQTAKVSVDVILNLTESPETHIYIVRKEVVESMLEICEQK